MPTGRVFVGIESLMIWQTKPKNNGFANYKQMLSSPTDSSSDCTMALLNQRHQQTLAKSDFPTPVNWNVNSMRYKLKMSQYMFASCALVCFEPTFHVGNVVGFLGKEQPINRLARSGNGLFVDEAWPKPRCREGRVHPTDSMLQSFAVWFHLYFFNRIAFQTVLSRHHLN